MLTLVTGAPGTGKTAAIVDLLHTIGKDRPLFVHGLDGLQLPHVELKDPTKWMDEVPDGAAVIIDEVQTIWRPRGPGVKVPDHVAALETHRHRGLDFFMTTQGPNLVDANVRALIGRHIHLRELGVLGRMWYEWPECADNCRTGFRGAPIRKRYKLPRHVFKDYKSASIHVKPIRSFPMALVVAIASISIVVYMAWGWYGKLQDKMRGGPPAAQTIAPNVSAKEVPKTDALERQRAALSGQQATQTPGAGVSPTNADARPVGANPGLAPPPAVAFAGCVHVKGHCECFDTRGAIVEARSAECKRAYGDTSHVLGFVGSDSVSRPSADPAADLALIKFATRRQPLPLVY